MEAFTCTRALQAHGLVTLTWGNASAIDRDRGLVVITPSGMAYDEITAADLLVASLDEAVRAKHYERKHGSDRYNGQP